MRGCQLAGAAGHEDAVLGPRQQRTVQAGEPLLLDLARQLLQAFQLALRPELQRHQGLGAGAHPVGDVVARHDKVAPLVVAAADHDVGVRVAGVEQLRFMAPISLCC